MNFSTIIEHMNSHHQSNLIDLCKKFSNSKKIEKAILQSVDFEGLDIIYNDDQTLRINFPTKADVNTIKDIIIELCMNAKSDDLENIHQEIDEFIAQYNSIILATLTENGETTCSYAPFFRFQSENYIYISQISEHFHNIKTNPNNIEVMFLEDECKASSVTLRKRLRYKASASILERDAEFDKKYDEFEKQTKDDKAVKMIRSMLDFHLIKLDFHNGRFVKGFGKAYDIQDGKIIHIKGKHPHQFSHKK
ncbi:MULTISPECIES: HugZ family heme oxygenase [unclassified Campylobacter]|uniref:HugZ family heme oxygenase n=1 Tax=unclassified Campylobacter TaxID=2593542 RepID=UPI000EAA1AED|nr:MULTISPECIES: HugZ family heme oxygenase [unclassified Campylobacter]QOR01825.1 HugZ family heme oxygenase [Campylobacter sp. 2014D-0216]RKO65096.1 HugZ family heme oxygenase [Campylobacter sp. P255]